MKKFKTPEQIMKDAVEHPYSYWGKRSDKVVHVPDYLGNIGGGVYCGKYGALLGNNYAPDLLAQDAKICPDCLKQYFGTKKTKS